MLVNSKEMLEKAKVGKYAVAHFNINNLEWTKYILEEIEELKQPAILGVSEGAIKYMGGYTVVSNIVKSLLKELSITTDICLHLDHGSSFESCKKAIDAGFTSVMIDASKHHLEENIQITKSVVDYAHPLGVTVEAELGHIGGNEDGIESDSSFFARIDECIELVNKTGVDSLAPALGSVHGLYKGEAKLDFETMHKISEAINIPLVLHGGTGISDEKIATSISCGISKININTELQVVWHQDVTRFILENKEEYDPRKIISSGKNSLQKKVAEKINLFSKRDTSASL